jgi:hypothetical protein
MEQQELSLLVGMPNGAATLEDSLAVSYKIKHITICSSNCTPWYLLKGIENISTPKVTHECF